MQQTLARWQEQLASYEAIDGRDETRLPHTTHISDWLNRNRPRTTTTGLLHGDFHLGNVLVRHDRPEVAALVDWELSTIGDPLLDLGQLIVTWPYPGGPFESRLVALGLPTPRELINRYASQIDRSVAGLPWFCVLAAFRLAVLLEGTQARAHAGLAREQVGRDLHERAVCLMQTAVEYTNR